MPCSAEFARSTGWQPNCMLSQVPIQNMSAKKTRVERINHSLELDESIDLHEKGWKVQRVAWVFIIAFVLLAALGLFGNGPLSIIKSSQKDISIEYHRFLRRNAEMEIKFESMGNSSIDSVTIPQQYLKNFKLEQIVPEPEHTRTSKGNIIYTFDAEDDNSVVIYLTSKKTGSVDGLWLVNSNNFQLSHFIYP